MIRRSLRPRPYPVAPPMTVAFTTSDGIYHRLQKIPMWDLPGPACGDPQPYRVKAACSPDVTAREMCLTCYPDIPEPLATELLDARPRYHNRAPIITAMVGALVVWGIIAVILIRS